MSNDPLEPARTPEERPRIGGSLDEIAGGTTRHIARHVGSDTRRSMKAPDETDETPALACLDCEAVWTDAGDEWAHCPRCGSDLTEMEVADE